MAPDPKHRQPILKLFPLLLVSMTVSCANFCSLENSLFQVVKGNQSAVKQLKGVNSYNGTIQQL